MNNYEMKKDRAGSDESFPYPIKLEYDDENIYLTVLRIPKPEELKLSPWVMNQLAKNHTITNYESRLVLCIERDNPKKYGQNERPPYRPNPGSGTRIEHIPGHPARGGNFSMVNKYNPTITYSNTGKATYDFGEHPQLIYNNVKIGSTYIFPIDLCLNNMAKCINYYNNPNTGSYENWALYSKIRGTFRFNVKHPHINVSGVDDNNNQIYYITKRVFYPLYERTGIYSNTAVMMLDPQTES